MSQGDTYPEALYTQVRFWLHLPTSNSLDGSVIDWEIKTKHKSNIENCCDKANPGDPQTRAESRYVYERTLSQFYILNMEEEQRKKPLETRKLHLLGFRYKDNNCVKKLLFFFFHLNEIIVCIYVLISFQAFDFNIKWDFKISNKVYYVSKWLSVINLVYSR